jgi:beta-aspartyl-peptidase (threonine type)
LLMNIAIIVHGGAGSWNLDSPRVTEAQQACTEAAATGQSILLAGGSALDAVEAAVRILEDCPILDAGRGSYLNADGEVEMDALIMDGRTLQLGAVAAVQRVRNPISLARHIMEGSDHNFFVGKGAEEYADSINFPRCSVDELLVKEELEKLHELEAQMDGRPTSLLTNAGPLGDTVGAVALDQHGNLAVATSTGGTRNKLPGRVGDSPLVGSGGYADNWKAAASATGHGEDLMRIVISKQVCDFVAQGLSAQSACEAAIRLLEERTNGEGGLIAIDARGRIGFAYNTAAMPYAFAVGNDPITGGR